MRLTVDHCSVKGNHHVALWGDGQIKAIIKTHSHGVMHLNELMYAESIIVILFT